MKNLLRALFVIAFLFHASCKEKEELKPENHKSLQALTDLQGTWVDTTWLNSYTYSYMLDELIIQDHSYIYSRTTYRDNNSPDNEYSFQSKGEVVINNNQISLIKDKRLWWLKETSANSIVKYKTDRYFFLKDSDYVIDNNKLTVFYITYPFDGPMNTSQTFTKR